MLKFIIHILDRACDVWSCREVSFQSVNGLELKDVGIRVEIAFYPALGERNSVDDDDVVHTRETDSTQR